MKNFLPSLAAVGLLVSQLPAQNKQQVNIPKVELFKTPKQPNNKTSIEMFDFFASFGEHQGRIDMSSVQEAINCVLSGKAGKTILLAQDYPGVPSQKRIVVVNDGIRYTVDVTKTYPHPYIETFPGGIPQPEIKSVEEIPKGSFTVTNPYLSIMARKDGTSSLDSLWRFSDGNPEKKLYMNGEYWKDDYISYKEGTPEYKSAVVISTIMSSYVLDGVVDSGYYPEEKERLKEIIANYKYPLWLEKVEKDFLLNRKFYQSGYKTAIMDILQACKKN